MISIMQQGKLVILAYREMPLQQILLSEYMVLEQILISMD
jgi:3-polyprenyl-4-hydroxybenzoate decarboxylase